MNNFKEKTLSAMRGFLFLAKCRLFLFRMAAGESAYKVNGGRRTQYVLRVTTIDGEEE